jgi:L-fuconolactonase
VIDAYAHCGASKYLPVEQVRSLMDGAGIERAVLCQHLGEYDNSYLESIVRAEPDRFAAVALVDGTDDGWRLALRAVAHSGAFRGLRIVDDVLDENPALAEEAASLGLVIVVYAPAGIARAVDPIRRLLDSRPSAIVEITHLGNPRLEDGVMVSGFELLELAVEPGVVVTLSGLPMFCDFPHHELDKFITQTVDAFGRDRVLWGSNLPVGGADQAAYDREVELINSGRWDLDASAVELLTDGNARRVWFERRDQ